MPIYKYTALTDNGVKKGGTIFADDYKHAYDFLVAKKKYPLKISKVFFVSRKVNLEDLLMFFMHIDFQLKCGVNIDQAIESFMDFYGNKVLNASLATVLADLKNGESISAAFEKCGSVFDNVIVGLIKSAEETGQIVEAIYNILVFLKLQSEWKTKVKQAVAYPMFITAVAIIVLILSITILGPQVISLVQTLDNKDVSLLTRFAIDVLPKISTYFFSGILAICVSGILMSFTKDGRELLSKLVLKIPKIGPLILKVTSWHFCKVLHIALSAKLDFIHGLKLAIESIKFRKNEMKKILDYIVEGHKVSKAFAQTKIVSESQLMAIYVGENGNNLTSCFEHISDGQYKELLADIKTFGQFLSAGLTIFTGLIFVFILCSLFYPIYSYVEVVGG